MEDERLLEARKIVQEFQSLVKSPGWERLVSIANEQVESRRSKLCAKSEGSEFQAVLLDQEFMRGEVAGLAFMRYLPHTMIEESEDIIDQFKETEDESGSSEES